MQTEQKHIANNTLFFNLTLFFYAQNARRYLVYGEDLINVTNGNTSGYQVENRFTGHIKDAESGLYYMKDRYKNNDGFISTDRHWYNYPHLSPYNYCGWNPIRFNDPTGMAANPIFDKEGEFLGIDDKGLKGEPIIMEKKDFKQGMSHDEAMAKGTTRSSLPKVIHPDILEKIDNKTASLPSRPDYDGFVTAEEGIAWAKAHPNALANPTPENTLYINTALLDFGNIGLTDFKNGVGKSSPINLLNATNMVNAQFNSNLYNTVYALGRVDIMLLDRNRNVTIVNNSATDYDWNTGGGWVRNSLINRERKSKGLNDTHGFKVFYYGVGKIRY